MNKKERLDAIEEIKEDSNVLEFVAITMQEKEDLQKRWDSLREWLETRPEGIYHYNVFEEILDKMNELEGGDNVRINNKNNIQHD